MTEARPRKQVNIYTDGACSAIRGRRLGLLWNLGRTARK